MAARGTAPSRRDEQPVRKGADELTGKVGGRGRPQPPPPRRKRYAPYHDIEGPKVRLGVTWFFLALAAISIGPLTTAVVYGGVASVAAAQTARCWKKRRQRPNELVAAALPVAMAFGACLGAGGGGLALLAGVGFAYVAASGDRTSPYPTMSDVGLTLQCGLPPGILALSMVLLCRLDQGSAIALLLLVSAYEIGDFLIGSGSRNPYEGPVAGGSAVVVVTFILSAVPISALGFREAWLFGGLVLVLAPLGQLLASAILPTRKSPATALRRLDSLLIAAPAWCIGIGIVIS
ncbi:MAG: hypothetical protein ABWZ76_06650 [Acidimicrobiales bacterium]